LYVSFVVGWLVWIPAFIGLLTILFYTGPINRNAVLCLVAPGIGFGSCMVMGTHYALTGSFSFAAFAASLIPFFLVSNLLLLNQFPDVEADKSVGRRHFPITIGRPACAKIYFVFLIATFSIIILSVLFGIFPRGALAGMFMVIPAFPLQIGIFKNADDLKALEPFMGINVLMSLLTPFLVAAGIFLTL
ncbi:prenyltransferase, partial [bacterium]|nr:prenyltransferase [bacterium]